ncbi:MAG: 30S ribosomal protein S27ae [Candidatus Aenigmarchaeota archaeon]|nr:30S ribosomal protein S27ae [Candidatus Aenigmarchaeota archaeon]
MDISKKYEIKDSKLVRKFKKCPKCMNMLADMKDRHYCGLCKYTEFLKNKE